MYPHDDTISAVMQPLPDLLRVPEAAQILRRTPDTVHRWVRSGVLPAVQIGSTRMIRREDLAALMGAAPDGDGPPEPPQRATGDLLAELIHDARRALDALAEALTSPTPDAPDTPVDEDTPDAP